MDGRTPKELIDEQITAEIKVLLHESHLTVTEIAQQLHFADQSNMSRFSGKHRTHPQTVPPADVRARGLGATQKSRRQFLVFKD